MGIVYMLIASLLYGIAPSVQKVLLLRGVTPLALVVVCSGFAALFALPAAFGAVSTFCAETISDLIPPLVTVLFYRRKLGWIREQALSHRAAQSAKTASMTC